MANVITLQKIVVPFILLIFFVGIVAVKQKNNILGSTTEYQYWFILHRQSNLEELYQGLPGDKTNSNLIKTFTVKTGIPGERPTPLHAVLGKEYWLITAKKKVEDNPETAPYFLSLNIPVGEDEPYGPVPYLECAGQCNWILPGEFGLHGVAGDPTKLSPENPGSSGCVRHTDEDITHLYNLLDTSKEIRYYIQDN